jgi:hypothetical protein
MKVQLKSQLIAKFYTLLVFLYVFVPQVAVARTYGSEAYGTCEYGEDCPVAVTETPQTPASDGGFFDKYGWILFAALFLLSLFLFFLLLAKRRRKKEEENQTANYNPMVMPAQPVNPPPPSDNNPSISTMPPPNYQPPDDDNQPQPPATVFKPQ